MVPLGASLDVLPHRRYANTMNFKALDSAETLQEMLSHIESAPEIYRPSKFWTEFQAKNIEQLRTGGMANFKRTINQNYFNWMVATPDNNQFKAAIRTFESYPHADAFNVLLERQPKLEGFFETNPLNERDGHELYRIYVGLLMNFATRSVPNGLGEVLDERLTGNPIRAWLNGRLISQDLANSLRERNTICQPFEAGFAENRKIKFVEIGAGYGRLVDMMMRSAPCQCVIVDVAPALYVSQWYLSKIYRQIKTVFNFRPWSSFEEVVDEFHAADLAFVTPDQFAILPKQYFDAAAAISNLAEMTAPQAANYISLLSEKVRTAVYIKQWITSTNGFDGHTFHRTDFALPKPWLPVVDRIDAIQDLFFETLWVR